MESMHFYDQSVFTFSLLSGGKLTLSDLPNCRRWFHVSLSNMPPHTSLNRFLFLKSIYAYRSYRAKPQSFRLQYSYI